MASCSTNLIDVKQRFSLLLRIFQLQFEFHNGIVSEIDSKDKKLSINRDEYTSKVSQDNGALQPYSRGEF